jgi:hypothetical protein
MTTERRGMNLNNYNKDLLEDTLLLMACMEDCLRAVHDGLRDIDLADHLILNGWSTEDCETSFDALVVLMPNLKDKQ